MRARWYPSPRPGAACECACERFAPLAAPCPFALVLRGANERRVQEIPGRAYIVLSQGVCPVRGAKPAGIMPCKGQTGEESAAIIGVGGKPPPSSRLKDHGGYLPDTTMGITMEVICQIRPWGNRGG